MTTTKASSDTRPESYRVDEGSIRLVQHGGISEDAKVKLWRPFIAPSIWILIEENKTAGRSLGIIRPQPESIKFIVKEAKDSNAEDQEVADLVFHEQASLLEGPLKPLEKPKHSFSYQFTCADRHAAPAPRTRIRTRFTTGRYRGPTSTTSAKGEKVTDLFCLSDSDE